MQLSQEWRSSELITGISICDTDSVVTMFLVLASHQIFTIWFCHIQAYSEEFMTFRAFIYLIAFVIEMSKPNNKYASATSIHMLPLISNV